MVLQQEATTYNDAFNQLAEGIASAQQQRVKVGSFYEFLRDIWSQSFEHPEYLIEGLHLLPHILPQSKLLRHILL